MARKSNKDIANKTEAFYRLKRDCLIRQKEYTTYYSDYIKLISQQIALEEKLGSLPLAAEDRPMLLNQYNVIIKKKTKILQRYNTLSMPSPNISNSWQLLYGDKCVRYLRDRGGYENVWRTGTELFEVDFSQDIESILYESCTLIKKMIKTKEIITLHNIPKESRKLATPKKCVEILPFSPLNKKGILKVFIYQDSKKLELELRQLLRKAKTDAEHEYSPHLYKFDRYFAVWDLRQQNYLYSQKKWPYELIVRKLQNDGYYLKKPLKKAILLARQDNKNAYKLLKISKQIYKKSVKPIAATTQAKSLKEEQEIWEKKLADEGMPALREQIVKIKRKEAYIYEGFDKDKKRFVPLRDNL